MLSLAAVVAFSLRPADWKVRSDLAYDRAEVITAGDEAADLLGVVAERQKAAFDSIRTWRASYRFSDRSILGRWWASQAFPAGEDVPSPHGPVERVLEGSGRFVCDLAGDRLLTSFRIDTPQLLTELETGREIRAPNTRIRQADTIVLPDEVLHLEPGREIIQIAGYPGAHAGGRLPGRVAFRDPRAYVRDEMWGDVVDPRNFYAAMRGPSVWEQLERRSAFIRTGDADPERYEVRLSGTGDVPAVWYSSVFPADGGRPHIRQTWRFDPGQDYLPISWQQFIGAPNGETSVDRELSWSWELAGDLRVLAAVTKTDLDSVGSIAFQRVLRFQDQVLNEPIDPAVFTPAGGLGLKDGENLVDRVEEELLVMESGTPVAVADPDRGWFWWWVAGGAVVLGVSAQVVRRRLAA